MKKDHLFEVDFARGLAVIAMIFYHFVFSLDFFAVLELDMQAKGFFIWARMIQFTFLSLVGVSLWLSWKKRREGFVFRHWKKALLIAFAALLITIFSYIFVPEYYVRFGILHLIAVSVFVVSPFVRYPYLCLFLAIIFALLPGHGPDYASLDDFSNLSWFSLPFLGVYLGQIFYPKRQALLNVRTNFVVKIGQNALLIYLLHIPIVAGLAFIVGLLLPSVLSLF